MAASYPSSVKAFTTKLTTDVIQAEHVNSVQDEVTAVEGGLINGIAHPLIPDAAGTRDLGSTAKPWRNLYLTGLPLDLGLVEGRLTLTSGTPVTTADVTGATAIYFAPYRGNRVALYTSTVWTMYAFTELTLSLGTLTNDLPYDVFLYDNAGTLTLEAVAWSSKTVRATALTTQDGVLVKSGSTNKRYLGTFHTTATTTTEDSVAKRLLWNYYNRVIKPMRVQTGTASWSYTTDTWRQANASTANQLAVVQGWNEDAIDVLLTAHAENSSGGIQFRSSIGEDSTTTPAAEATINQQAPAAAINIGLIAAFRKVPAVGYHFYAWLERSVATGTTTWNGCFSGTLQSGIHGSWRC